MAYLTRLWRRVFQFSSLPFGLDRSLFALPQGWKISFGIWVKYTVDSPMNFPSTLSGGKPVYSPLLREEEQIRLLVLHPGKSNDTLMTSLVTVDLRQAPPYEALSYVWGNSFERGCLYINGHAVEIHAGLFNALHTLRSPHYPKMFWADAICINQADDAEQTNQIQLMGRIYATAKNVDVYLGKPNERTAEGMRCLKYFMETNLAQDPPWSDSELLEVKQNLEDILTRPWFERIWTVQEATLARHTTLVCGAHHVSWNGDLRTLRSIVFRIKAAAISPYFSSAWGGTRSSALDWSPLLNILETQMRQAARREGVILRRNHLDLAFDYRHRRSTDPRDKYHALFGIVENDQGGDLTLAPDYRIRLEELHERFITEVRRIGEIEDVFA